MPAPNGISGFSFAFWPENTDPVPVFDQKAYQIKPNMDDFVLKLENEVTFTEGLVTQAEQAKTAAEAAETNAAGYEAAAQSAAQTAALVVNAQPWVSGTTYGFPDAVVSPLSGLTYRAVNTHVSTTDPSLDVTNWVALNGAGAAIAVSDAAYDPQAWDGNFDVPTKNAIRDLIEGPLVPAASDAVYDPQIWDGDQDVPTKNAVRDVIENLPIPVASDAPYDPVLWDGNTDVPTKNAMRDQLEAMGSLGASDIFIVQFTMPNGQSGGPNQDNLWVDVPLNTIVKNDISATLISTNYIGVRLPAGKYRVRGFQVLSQSRDSTVKLLDQTSNSDLIQGASCYFPSGNGMNGTPCPIDGEFEIATQSDIRFQYFVDRASNNGLGLAASAPGNVPEVYGQLTFEKVA